jgi:hypothetical protein
MSSKKDNYPFVPISLAILAVKYGFKEHCYAMYEKGYKDDDTGEKIKAKLFRTDISNSIKSTIELLKNSKHYADYLKRPGMFEGGSIPPWIVPAPTYHQLADWMYDEFKIHFEILITDGWNWSEAFKWRLYDNKSGIIEQSEFKYNSKKETLKDVITIILKSHGYFFKRT